MMPDKNEYDVVVVGSGGGAMLAACRAADQGLSVLIVEKCAMYGGTTAISGGGIWIPTNHLAMEAGARDSFDEACTYVRACVGDASSEARIRTYLEQGPRMVRYLHDKTRVRFTTLPEYADYFQHQPGAKPGHRSLDPVPFDARRLGKEFERQRRGQRRTHRHDTDRSQADVRQASRLVWSRTAADGGLLGRYPLALALPA
jgi:3-oxosteroid 1-dehydrogenase